MLDLKCGPVSSIISRVSAMQKREAKPSLQSALARFQYAAFTLYTEHNDMLDALRL